VFLVAVFVDLVVSQFRLQASQMDERFGALKAALADTIIEKVCRHLDYHFCKPADIVPATMAVGAELRDLTIIPNGITTKADIGAPAQFAVESVPDSALAKISGIDAPSSYKETYFVKFADSAEEGQSTVPANSSSTINLASEMSRDVCTPQAPSNSLSAVAVGISPSRSVFMQELHAFDSEENDETVVEPFNFLDAEEDTRFNPFRHTGGRLNDRYSRFLEWVTNLPPPRQGVVADFVKGSLFRSTSILVILLNFAFMVFVVDRKAADVSQNESDELTMISFSFQVYYVIELAARSYAYQGDFFFGEDWCWNLFDVAIVLQGAIDSITKLASDEGSSRAGFLRIIRVMKISKVLRMFDVVRSIKELRMMVDALVGSVSIFIWCSILLVFFLSVVSIFLVSGVTAFLTDPLNQQQLSSGDLQELQENFGSVGDCILALFKATSGGDDWSFYHDLLKKVGPEYHWGFLAFQAFTVIAFSNVITGVFAEKALDLARPSLEELVEENRQEYLKDSRKLMKMLKRVLGYGHLQDEVMDQCNFEVFMEESEVKTYFMAKGMTPPMVQRFFTELCEMNRSSQVPMSIFVSACIKLNRLQASKSDVQMMSVRQLKSIHQLKRMLRNRTSWPKRVEKDMEKEGIPENLRVVPSSPTATTSRVGTKLYM
jgi:hypothetical protein